MRFIFTSYASSPEYTLPEAWLKRIEGYTGILEMLGREHVVTAFERISYEGKLQKNGVQYHFIRQSKKVNRFPFHMHRRMKQLEPDVVFINGFIFPLQIIQLRLQLGRKVKIVILHRAEKPFRGIKKQLQRLADKCVNAYFFSAQEFGNSWIESGITNDRGKFYEIIQGSSVFQQGDKENARRLLGLTGKPVFLWVGRLDENKDPLTVVKGFLEFHRVEPAARLYMIYQDDKLITELEQLFYSYNKNAVPVKLIGSVPHDELAGWFNAADFIISGSHYEGSGIAVCEAMSCACIPIVTNIPSFRSMTGLGEYGLLYEPGNENSLLAALLQTRELDIRARQHKVRVHFEKEFSFTAIARKTNEAITSLLNHH